MISQLTEENEYLRK
jgi:hypothetical protein